MSTRVDFYQLSRDPVEQVAVMLARKVLQAGKRLLIVSDNPGQRATIGKELWRGGKEEFLANGQADAAHADKQPILLSGDMDPANGASMCERPQRVLWRAGTCGPTRGGART